MKACFELVMAYGDFKDLSKRTASHKILPDKAILLKTINKMEIHLDFLQ